MTVDLTRPDLGHLTGEELAAIDAWWRACNYLTIGQIYLKDNVLLSRPLRVDDIKPRLLGHWGTSPGLSFIYAHVSRLITLTGQEAIYLAGPGHGGPALVAASWLEGYYSEIYPDISRDGDGMHRLFRQFSSPGGIPSHVSVTTPGSIHEGGELGYVLVHAFGSVMDNPNLLSVAVVGDGEAETGPLEGSWKGISFLNPRRDGAVLPILHLNGAKIAGPTVLGRKPPAEVRSLFEGHGYEVIEVEGSDLPGMHHRFATALAKAYELIAEIQESARTGRWDGRRPRWPMIILRSPKGWTGPAEVDGIKVTGTWRSHQVPLSGVRENPEHLRLLESWLRSYHPDELFGPDGAPTDLVLAANVTGELRMSASPHANGGLLRRPLDLPDFRDFALSVDRPATRLAESTRQLGGMLAEIYRRNPDRFRLFSPDETNSNRLGSVFDVSDRAFMERVDADDVKISADGRVMEVLSEHNCHGWLEGYTLTGRHGLFATYEAFAMVSASQTVQHSKWLEEADRLEWRARIPSFNVLLTSTAWRNDHNGFSHQGPGLIQVVLTHRGEVTRVYLPPDANCLLSVADHCLRSTSYVNLIVIDKQPQLQYLSIEEAARHCARGAGIWPWAGNDDGTHRAGHRARLCGRHRDHGDRGGRADPPRPAAPAEDASGQRGRPDGAHPTAGPSARDERHVVPGAVHRCRRCGLLLPRFPGGRASTGPWPARRRPLPRPGVHRTGHDHDAVRHDREEQGVPLPPGDGRGQQRRADTTRIVRTARLVRSQAGGASCLCHRTPRGHARGQELDAADPYLKCNHMRDSFVEVANT